MCQNKDDIEIKKYTIMKTKQNNFLPKIKDLLKTSENT